MEQVGPFQVSLINSLDSATHKAGGPTQHGGRYGPRVEGDRKHNSVMMVTRQGGDTLKRGVRYCELVCGEIQGK